MNTLLAAPPPKVGDPLERCFQAGAVIGLLLVTAAGSGLFLDAYDGETVFARNGYRGADVVSLFLAVPALAVGARLARRGSTTGLLLWLGALGYVVYQYAYVFAYGWSGLFPVYLALFSLAAFTLARALAAIDPHDVAARFHEATPVRPVARYLWFVGIGLGLIEVGQIVGALVTGDPPQIVTDTGHPTSPVFVLDVGFVVPLMLVAGSWLRRRRPWGYVLAAMMLVKGTTVGLGLLFANLFALAGDGKGDGPLVGLWLLIAAGSAWFLVRLLGGVRGDREGRRTPLS